MTTFSPDVRDVHRAVVHKQGRLAATLERGDGGVRFAYDPGYLDLRGPAVATTLPLSEEPVTTAGGAARGRRGSINVLTLRGAQVAEITSFIGAEHFPQFGLPDSLP